jgi:hypothetical protein
MLSATVFVITRQEMDDLLALLGQGYLCFNITASLKTGGKIVVLRKAGQNTRGERVFDVTPAEFIPEIPYDPLEQLRILVKDRKQPIRFWERLNDGTDKVSVHVFESSSMRPASQFMFVIENRARNDVFVNADYSI